MHGCEGSLAAAAAGPPIVAVIAEPGVAPGYQIPAGGVALDLGVGRGVTERTGVWGRTFIVFVNHPLPLVGTKGYHRFPLFKPGVGI